MAHEYKNPGLNPSGSHMVTGLRAGWVRLGLLLNIFRIALAGEKNLYKAFRSFNKIRTRRKRLHNLPRITRFVKCDGKYYWSENIPGYPSKNMDTFLGGELKRNNNANSSSAPLQTIIFAITNRCPLSCLHCYEWVNLQSKEHLTRGELMAILKKLQALGLRHIQFSGGEPLVRFEDLIALCNEAKNTMDVWILTSGYGLTATKALQLKQAGLTGANISLDHWDEAAHNAFRNNSESFCWVKQAVSNCQKAGVLVCLSLCTTRDFLSEQNLYKYLDLAKKWGVNFMRVLEPREIGRYNGEDVTLRQDQVEILEAFFQKTNRDPAFGSHPIVMYPGYHQRKAGCFGAGNRYLYIDSRGDIHACPFCQNAVGNAITGNSIEAAIEKLKTNGCHEFILNTAD